MSDKPAVPQQPSAKSKPGLSKNKAIALVILVIVLLIAVSIIAARFLSGQSDDRTLAAHEYRVVNADPVTDTVLANGKIDAGTTATLRSSLTSPVQKVEVKVGDKVVKGQTLVVIDTQSLHDQLDAAITQHNTASDGARQTLTQAETALSQYQQQLSQGLDSQLNSAKAALRDANQALADAQRDFTQAKARRNAEDTPQIVAASKAVDAARQQLFTTSLNAVRAGLGSAVALTGDKVATPPNGSPIPESAINTHLSTVDAAATVVAAQKNLNEAQRNYQEQLSQVDDALAKSQSAVATAFNHKRDAAVGLEAAKLGSQQRLEQLSQAVDTAKHATASAASNGQSTIDKLTADISKATITAPFDGVVTSVGATEGVPASGELVTLANRSKLIVKTNINEVDLNSVKVGQKVDITTTLTGKKLFHGTVTTLSPVASNLAPSGPGAKGVQTGGDDKPTFPVEITIDDPTDELRIGGTAKTKIITKSQTEGIKVSRDAVVDGPNNTHFVLVITGTDPDKGKVEKRAVTPGVSNDFDIAVVGDVHVGDRVINQGKSHVDLVDKTVSLAHKDAPKDANDKNK